MIGTMQKLTLKLKRSYIRGPYKFFKHMCCYYDWPQVRLGLVNDHLVEMNGGLENVHFPWSICQFVSCNAKSGSTFWHGRARSGANGHPSFWWWRPLGGREGCFGHYHYYNGQQESPLEVGRITKRRIGSQAIYQVQGDCTGCRTAKWRETKQQLSRARIGNQLSCCLFSLHFLCDILSGRIVLMYVAEETLFPCRC